MAGGAQNPHIGIVSVSSEGGALCYRQILREASNRLDPHDHPIVSVHNVPLAWYVDAVRRDDWREVGRLLRESCDKLAGVGAQVIVAPDNATQHGVHLAEVGSPVPWLNMTELVAEAISADGHNKVGLIGTRTVTGGAVYQTHLGLKGVKAVAPSDEDAEAMDAIIFGELVYGWITPATRARMLGIVKAYQGRGCDGVILGCSEAPLVITEEDSPLPVYDATVIVARAAIDWAIGSGGQQPEVA
ncbi:MAG: aspartate racemase [Phycisphaeraceae bacterium]|nr:MAG: aspartate racemase [Phycisphaeraceae bacterium]